MKVFNLLARVSNVVAIYVNEVTPYAGEVEGSSKMCWLEHIHQIFKRHSPGVANNKKGSSLQVVAQQVAVCGIGLQGLITTVGERYF